MPKLRSRMLEAIATKLSDRDLINFMLASKESSDATLDVLSTVNFVCCQDENLSMEQSIAFVMKGK